MKKLEAIRRDWNRRPMLSAHALDAQNDYLLRVAAAACEAVDRWQDSGDGTYQNMEWENAMDRLEALLEEEA